MNNQNDRQGKIIQGDCLEVMRGMADNSVDLVLTDPPYLTTNQKWDKNEVVSAQFSHELYRIAKPSASLYVWCGIGEKSQSLVRWLPIFSEHWHFKDLITWKKQRGIGMRKGWLYTREECLWFVKDNQNFIWNIDKQYDVTDKRLFSLPNNKSDYRRWTNVWTDIKEVAGSMKSNPHHYTAKPIELFKRIIEAHTSVGDIVFDPFLGSGTTAVAAQRLDRNYIGIEINPDYVKIAQDRLKQEVLL